MSKPAPEKQSAVSEGAAQDATETLLETACDRQRVAIIFNPASGADDTMVRRSALEGLARAAGLTCQLVETTINEGAGPLAEQALRDGMERVIVSGGDGSVTEAAHGLAGTRIALAVVPGGTGNLLAGNLGIPLDHATAMRLALSGAARPIDVGRANGTVFLVAAGMGLDARMIRDANREMKARWGKLAYIVSAWHNLHRSNARYTITIDGQRIQRSAQMVMIANLGRITAGLELVPDSDPDDGLLDVAILRSRGPLDLARLGWRMVLGRARSDDLLEIHHGRHILVEPREPQPIQIDGTGADRGRRLEARIEPQSLLLVRPDGASPEAANHAVEPAAPHRAVAIGLGVAAIALFLLARRRRGARGPHLR